MLIYFTIVIIGGTASFRFVLFKMFYISRDLVANSQLKNLEPSDITSFAYPNSLLSGALP